MSTIHMYICDYIRVCVCNICIRIDFMIFALFKNMLYIIYIQTFQVPKPKNAKNL